MRLDMILWLPTGGSIRLGVITRGTQYGVIGRRGSDKVHSRTPKEQEYPRGLRAGSSPVTTSSHIQMLHRKRTMPLLSLVTTLDGRGCESR